MLPSQLLLLSQLLLAVTQPLLGWRPVYPSPPSSSPPASRAGGATTRYQGRCSSCSGTAPASSTSVQAPPSSPPPRDHVQSSDPAASECVDWPGLAGRGDPVCGPDSGTHTCPPHGTMCQVNDDDDVFGPYRTLFNLVTHSTGLGGAIFQKQMYFPQLGQMLTSSPPA